MSRKTRPKRRRVRTDVCLHCGEPAKCRGCCSACYQAINAQIKAGLVTDAEAVEQQLLRPAYQSKNNPARQALADYLARRTKPAAEGASQRIA